MKIALYELSDNPARYKYPSKADKYKENNTDYIRVSNIIEVNFDLDDEAIIIPKKVQCLRAKKVLIAKEIDKEISKLLAITHNPEA